MKLDTRLIGVGLPLLFLIVPCVYGIPDKRQVEIVPENVALAETLPELAVFPDELPASNCSGATVEEIAKGSEETCVHIGIPDKRQVEIVPENVALAETLPELAVLPDELPASNCSGATVEEMAKGSEETCVHIGNIEGYVNLVMSMIPLHIYYENHSDFTDIFKNYDSDLGVAQDHARLWRNGDSILLGIRQTFDLARQFEPAFTKKYLINKERVEVIKANEGKQINKDEIVSLKALLEEVETAMAPGQSPGHFQKIVDDLKAKIMDKERALTEDFTLIKELEELASFLEFVRRDSDKIRTQALMTKEMIEKFREYLEHDKGAFIKHGRVANETLKALEEETNRNNEALTENKRRQENLELKIEEKRKQVETLFEKINHSNEELRKMRIKFLNDTSNRKTLKVIGDIITTIFLGAFCYKHFITEKKTFFQLSEKTMDWKLLPPVLINAHQYQHATDEEKEFSQVLEETMANSNEVNVILTEIENNRAEMRLLQKQMANSTSNSDKLHIELTTFANLDGDLEHMADKIKTLLIGINKAIAGVVNIQGVFEVVSTKLTEMIDFAKNPETKAELLNASGFIYKELSLLECNWRDAYFKVLNLDDCTKNIEKLY